MGYFDGLTDSIFTTDSEGRWLFYPWGVLGKGYILPDEVTKQKVRSFIKRQYMILVPIVITIGTLVGWIYSLALFPIYLIWYFITIARITKRLQVTQRTLKMKESYENSAKSHNVTSLWAMLIGSILFVILSLAILTGLLPSRDNPEKELLIGVAGLIFFGFCSIVIGYMIKRRKA